MTYFAGKRPMNLPGVDKLRMPGEVVTAAEAAQFVNLRRMLETGELACDYKDGEKQPHEMDTVSRSTLVDARVAVEKLREEGILLDEAADTKFIYAVYDIVLLKRGVQETADRRGVAADALLRFGSPPTPVPMVAKAKPPRGATAGA